MATLVIRKVTQPEHDWLTQRAEAEGVSVAELVRRLIYREYVLAADRAARHRADRATP